jgi:hypothetical protein
LPKVYELYARLPPPKLAIENSAGAWAEDEQQVLAFLELPGAPNHEALK